MRRRLRAVNILRSGGGVRVRVWHGTWVVTAPTGRQQHVRTLDELFAILPPVPQLRAALGATSSTARRVAPPGWDPQAALVWTAAVAATGWRGQVGLPGAPSGALLVALHGDRSPAALRAATEGNLIRIDGPGADELVGSLLAVAGSR
jgi:hypothetical protein